MEPQVRFCTSADGTRIAYTTYGEPGREAVVSVHMWAVVQGFHDNVSDNRPYYEEVASDRQAVAFDRRGIGASQRDVTDVSLAAQVADLAAVVDDAGFKTFGLAGHVDGAAVAAAYAARYPERVSRLVLFDAYSCGAEITRPELTRSIVTLIQENWSLARRTIAGLFAPGMSVEAQRSLSRTLRDAIPANSAARYIDYQSSLDVRSELQQVRTPALIINRGLRVVGGSAAAVAVAALIPGARLVTLEDTGALAMARALRKFLDEAPTTERPETLPSGTAVILFADIADSTALMERLGDAAFRDRARELDEALRKAIADSGGAAIDGKLLGDGVLATFGGAREAIGCAAAIHAAGSHAGLALHIGIHAGDVIREANNVYGGAVNIASRISSEAASGETLVSATVRDLARTSAGVLFEDRGERELKGIAERVRLYEVRWRE